jgi:hypothetical protein
MRTGGLGIFGLALALLSGAPALAQDSVAVTGTAVTLYLPKPEGGMPAAAGRVATAGWGKQARLESATPPGTTQFVMIHFPGGRTEDGRDIKAGSYWVRKSALALEAPCVHMAVAPAETDRRAATNGAGRFCEPGQ